MSELRDSVAATAQGTPYVVVDTERGFNVELDVDDHRYRARQNWLVGRRKLSWRVKEHPSYFSITDVQSSYRRGGGIVGFGFAPQWQSGRIFSLSRKSIWAVTDDGRVAPVADYRFNAREGRDLIRLVARQLDLTERQPLTVNVATAAILVTPIAFAVYGLVWLALRLLGRA